MGEKRIFLENSVELPFIRCKGCNVLSIENYFPESGFSNPPRIRRSVVFPQPLGPKSVRNSFSDIKVQVVQNQIVSI